MSCLEIPPVNAFIGFSPSRPPFHTVEPATPAAARTSPPPALRPPSVFGLIFVVWSFSRASPCAVICNLLYCLASQGPPGSQPSPHAQPPPHNPSSMMGPHSQVTHCGPPARRPGGAGHQQDRARRGKTKIKTRSRPCL